MHQSRSELKARQEERQAAAKSAFEHMMHEIDHSDSEDEFSASGVASSYAKASPSVADSKTTASWSSGSARITEKEEPCKPTYEAAAKDLEIERFGAVSMESMAKRGSEDTYSLEALRSRLTRVLRKGDTPTLCYVERDRGGFNRLNTVYRLYLEPPAGSQRPATFMCSAKKQSGSKTSYYLISMEADPTDRGSEKLLGKLRANAVGSQYILYDGGLSPEKTVSPSMVRQELGVVQFIFDSYGPGTIQAWIPSTNAGGGSITWKPMNKSETIAHAIEHGEQEKLIHLRNKVPNWDEAHGGHVLNFHGRVTESSVKNFQICVQGEEDVSLQFGRVGKHKFTLDVSNPLTILQAFAICVASMDRKIADRKGYEMLKRLGGSKAPKEAEAVSQGDMRSEQTSSTPSVQYLRDKFRRSFKS